MDCVCWRSTDLCPIYSAPACDSPQLGSISSLIVRWRDFHELPEVLLVRLGCCSLEAECCDEKSVSCN